MPLGPICTPNCLTGYATWANMYSKLPDRICHLGLLDQQGTYCSSGILFAHGLYNSFTIKVCSSSMNETLTGGAILYLIFQRLWVNVEVFHGRLEGVFKVFLLSPLNATEYLLWKSIF
ncbi:hypothetical protein CHS0354_026601 [Potamilus streckersoni]|uniref:Uncharacterized protein n=1 Tax=Potamilus streckersoni TaxID=2493646 RepID=A0AAE0SVJ9_9BIVA|nr:hypothetical protein CHS0354_026601 [Potamilus streckersoni]